MDIKLVKNEKLNSTNRAREIHFIEIKVSKLENIDDVLAEKFIRDIVGVNFNLDFTDEMYEKIKITEKELEELKEKNIWYADVINKDDFVKAFTIAIAKRRDLYESNVQ